MTGIETALIGAGMSAGTAGSIGTLAGIASGVFSALGAIQNANAQSSALKYNAAINSRNALIARQQAAEDERRHRIMAAKEIGSMRAGYGASGVTLEGIPLDVLAESAYNAEMDSLAIRYGGRINAMGYEASAALDRMQARNAQLSGYARAGTALLMTDYSGFNRGGSTGYSPSSGPPPRKPLRDY